MDTTQSVKSKTLLIKETIKDIKMYPVYVLMIALNKKITIPDAAFINGVIEFGKETNKDSNIDEKDSGKIFTWYSRLADTCKPLDKDSFVIHYCDK